MYKIQKIILVSLVFISLIAWLFSIKDPDMLIMMEAMMTLNPIAISIFTISWTIGMTAMMFPAIVPMVILYNRLIVGNNHNNHNNNIDVSKQKNDNKQRQFLPLIFSSSVNYSIKTIVFVVSYLLIWSLTGILLLLSWSILMNNLFITYRIIDLDIVYGVLLIISGVYQFSYFKIKCLGYCESPLAFFTRRWNGSSTIGAIKMGTYHGLYCLGCCWPYFLLMVALGWMNIAWMGVFAGIIFGEKIWSKGIWISRFTGIAFTVVGVLTILGIITLNNDDLNTSTMDMSTMNMSTMDMS
jgi:predicted metal-binding membrane protein